MKKIIYSLALVMAGFSSCTSFDDEHSEKYADGPAVAINLVTTQDSCFTFTVTPGDGTQYYTYAVVEGSEAEEVDASSLLKNTLDGTVDGAIVKYATTPSATVNMRNAKNVPLCEPNTSYVVYAIAASDKGMTGAVSSLVVKTSDGNAPVANSFSSKDGVAYAAYSENIYEGTGSVTGVYYKEWDFENPVTIPSEDIKVAIDGNAVSFTTEGLPAGAYVFYSWPEGTFVDSYGNKCPAVSSAFNMSTGQPAGCYVHIDNVAWDIADKNITAPEVGSLIANVSDFKGVITFGQNVFRNDEAVKTGDISVVYTGSKKSTTIGLTADEWSVSGNTVTFILPETPAAGDIITVKIAEGVLFDVYGNGNNAYESTSKTVWWKFFAMTKDMALGNFNFSYVSYYDDTATPVDGGSFSISAYTEEQENGLLIKNFYLDGSELEGYYDLAAGKVYIYANQIIGKYTNSKGTTYGLVFVNAGGDGDVAFTVNADGTLTADGLWGVYAYDETYSSALGWFDVMSATTFTPSASAKKAYKTRAYKSGAKKVVKKASVRSMKRVSK